MSYLEADISRCISLGSRTGTRVLQHWDSSGVERTQPPEKHQIHGYVHKSLPPERANVSVQQTEHSPFQDLIDMKASVFAVIPATDILTPALSLMLLMGRKH